MQNLFNRTQDSIIIKSPALHDDICAEVFDVFKLHDFEQRVLDDAERDACRNVVDGRAFLLRLFNF